MAYVGVGSGAAAALIAAARRPHAVAAVICRSGEPDLAANEIHSVRTPTLFLVGGTDAQGIASSRRAFEQLECERDLIFIPGAGHLLDDPASNTQMQQAILRWLNTHVPANRE